VSGIPQPRTDGIAIAFQFAIFCFGLSLLGMLIYVLETLIGLVAACLSAGAMAALAGSVMCVIGIHGRAAVLDARTGRDLILLKRWGAAAVAFGICLFSGAALALQRAGNHFEFR